MGGRGVVVEATGVVVVGAGVDGVDRRSMANGKSVEFGGARITQQNKQQSNVIITVAY